MVHVALKMNCVPITLFNQLTQRLFLNIVDRDICGLSTLFSCPLFVPVNFLRSCKQYKGNPINIRCIRILAEILDNFKPLKNLHC